MVVFRLRRFLTDLLVPVNFANQMPTDKNVYNANKGNDCSLWFMA